MLFKRESEADLPLNEGWPKGDFSFRPKHWFIFPYLLPVAGESDTV
jgi:hypothetical protein